LVPAFEKMLCDNAVRARAYVNAYLLTGNAHFNRTTVETVDVIVAEMLASAASVNLSHDADTVRADVKIEVRIFKDDHDWLRAVAEESAAFILETVWDGRRLKHAFKDGQARFNGYLDDYANLIDGLFALYELTFEYKWLEHATQLTDRMIEQFGDEEGGGFYFTAKEHESLIARTKDYFDTATPSGNSVAAGVL